MRAPRRTPYERPDALAHLYSLLYPNDQFDVLDHNEYRQCRNQGLSIVHLWLNRSACPHAVESTGSLIHAQQLDENLVILTLLPTSSETSEWAVRCAYSTAILRFVNSVVDTFQTSMYAKSIFQISQTIGLPAYLVELRHAATHEELPSLQVLRDACKESLLWLQRNFWWPTIARQSVQSAHSSRPTSTTPGESSLTTLDLQTLQQEATAQLKLHLARYRKLAKRIVKDESLRGRYKNQLTAAQSRVEACARKSESDCKSYRGDWEEERIDGSAVSLLVDVLLEPGGIIPLSKRKRPRSNGIGEIALAILPNQLLQAWLPLLNHLSASMDSFAESLQDGLLGCLSQPTSSTGRSYQDTVASWIIALFADDKSVLAAPKVFSKQRLFSDLSEDDGASEQDKPTLLLVRKCLTFPTNLSLAIARQLCFKDEHLAEKVKPLLDMAEESVMGPAPKGAKVSIEAQPETERRDGLASELELSVLEMEKKLQALQDVKAAAATLQSTSTCRVLNTIQERNEMQGKLCKQLQGWAPASQDWKPTPIGCLDGVVPQLVLPDY